MRKLFLFLLGIIVLGALAAILVYTQIVTYKIVPEQSEDHIVMLTDVSTLKDVANRLEEQ